MTESKRILIGEIATAHGIKGYVKVRSFAEDETLLEHPSLFTDEEADKAISIKLKNALKGDWVAEVKGVSDRNEAERLRGTKLYIDRIHLPAAKEGQYYIEDLKGLKVVDGQGKEIGILLSVENFGASDLLDIKPPSGASFYLPFTEETVVGIDEDAGTITVEIPEGL